MSVRVQASSYCLLWPSPTPPLRHARLISSYLPLAACPLRTLPTQIFPLCWPSATPGHWLGSSALSLFLVLDLPLTLSPFSGTPSCVFHFFALCWLLLWDGRLAFSLMAAYRGWCPAMTAWLFVAFFFFPLALSEVYPKYLVLICRVRFAALTQFLLYVLIPFRLTRAIWRSSYQSVSTVGVRLLSTVSRLYPKRPCLPSSFSLPLFFASLSGDYWISSNWLLCVAGLPCSAAPLPRLLQLGPKIDTNAVSRLWRDT